jgi:succinoglycan biosynthesis protein ExoA
VRASSPAARLAPLPDDARVAVVIPARDAAATLPATLASVLAQQPPPDEVAVAVGPSTDGTADVVAEVAARDPRVRVVPNTSGRTPAALNAAIAATRAPVVARVDAHAVLPPGYLATAVATLRRTGAANVGGLQVPSADAGFARAVAAAMASPVGAGGAAYRSGLRGGPVDTVYLGVFRREALDAVGGFDDRFTRNQDAELNLRLRRAGYEVWLDPDLRVAYHPRSDVRSLARQYLQYGRWRRLTGRTHPGSLQARQLAPPAAVVALATATVAAVAASDARLLAVAGGGYATAVLGGAVHAAPELRSVPPTALALATMHLSWGVGFLLGPPRSVDASDGGRDGRC